MFLPLFADLGGFAGIYEACNDIELLLLTLLESPFIGENRLFPLFLSVI